MKFLFYECLFCETSFLFLFLLKFNLPSKYHVLQAMKWNFRFTMLLLMKCPNTIIKFIVLILQFFRFFQRAVQVHPRFAYAYTLLGHEYVFVEELDKALVAFRTAVRLDSRHYNAWYGIGLTYYKQVSSNL